MSALVDPQPALSRPKTHDAKPARKLFRDRVTIPLLLLLTLIAGTLRFTALDRPTIWGDEAATYGRVAGTYQELLDQLVNAMFTPLHYELTWWIGQGMPYWGTIDQKDITRNGEQQIERTFTPTRQLVAGGIRLSPFALRFIPALCGTLMVPAMYFLARQMFGPRASLLAAGFACFSAYLLVYSRDAKMYSDFWLMCVLHVGCLLWWLRVRNPLSWLCWVATGLAMMGLHVLGGIVLAVTTVIFLTSPRQQLLGFWKLLLIAGWVLAWPFVLIYRWFQKRYELIEWTTPLRYAQWGLVQCHRLRWPPVIFFVIGMFVIIRGPMMYYGGFNEKMGEAVAQDGTLNSDESGIGWVQRYNDGRSFDDLALYTTSAYLTGWEWPRNQADNGIDDQGKVAPRTLKLLQASTIALLSLLAIGVLPWRRVLQPARARLERITQDNRVFSPHVARRVFWIGFWLIIPAYGFYTQSYRWVTTPLDAVSKFALQDSDDRALRWPRLTKPPTDEAFVTLGSDKRFIEVGEKHRAWLDRFWTNYVDTLGKYRLLFKPDAHTAVWSRLSHWRIGLLAGAIVVVAAMLVWRWRSIWRTTLRLTIAIVVIAIVCQLLTVVPRFPDQIVWMPRYLGVIVPAFALIAAALVVRQPTWWLRTATIALFIIVNLSQFGARTFGQSEPPIALIAADVVRSQPRDTNFRAYTALSPRESSAEPGGGSLHNSPGSYYLRELSGIEGPARDVRLGRFHDRVRTWYREDPQTIANEVAMTRPLIDTFVVWTSMPNGAIDLQDPIADKLKGQFKRIDDEVWQVRDHWTWIDRWQMRRRTYQRIAPPPPPPEPKPATPLPASEPKPATPPPAPPKPPVTPPPPPAPPKPVAPPPTPALKPATAPTTVPAPKPPAPASTQPATRPTTQPATQPSK